jgi:hypothetical protein
MDGTAVNPGFATAAVLSLITFAVHTFVGGRFAARPLLDAHDFDKASRWLNYMTWHMVTVLLAVMPIGYGVAAVLPDSLDVAILLTAIAAVLSPLSVWVALKGGIAPWRFPSSWLFALIVLAALWGCFGPGGGVSVEVRLPVAA